MRADASFGFARTAAIACWIIVSTVSDIAEISEVTGCSIGAESGARVGG